MTQRMYYSEEARRRARKERTLLVSLAGLVGAGVGAILMLLFAPFSGDQARDKLESAVENGKDQLEDSVDHLQKIAPK